MSDRTLPYRDDESSLRYAGWRVVLGCFLLALFIFGFGLYGQGLFLAELQRRHDWPAALISGASTLSLLLSNILAIFTSEMIARLGLRRLVLLGIAGLAASVSLLAVAMEPWQLYLAFILMGVGWIGMGTVVIATLVGIWFVRRRGLAISLAFTGASFGGVVVAPLLVLLVEAIGFSVALLVATAVMIVILVPVVLLWIGSDPGQDVPSSLHSQPEQQAPSPQATRARILRQPAFWTVAAPFALALLAQVGFIVHQIALLEPKIGRPGAGFAVALTTSMAVIGRLSLGMVADRLDPRQVAAVSFASQALALLIVMQTDHAPLLYAGCAVFGFSVGNLISLPPIIIHSEFEAAAFTVVVGLSAGITGIVCSFGPAFVGLARSLSGSYEAALALCVALQLVAAVIVLGTRRHRDANP